MTAPLNFTDWAPSVHIDLAAAGEIVVVTGSGVSVASGIRAFRGEGGIAEEFDIETDGHKDQLKQDPARLWALFGELRRMVLEAEPNPAHLALAELENKLSAQQKFTLITQNIDGLHQKAGSRHVLELHGNLLKTRCSNENCCLQPFHDRQIYQSQIDRCRLCGSVLRPDVVLLGESIHPSESWKSKRVLRTCQLLLVIGASHEVRDIANMATLAHTAKSRILYINIDKIDNPEPAFREQLIGAAEEILPELVAQL